MKLMDIMELGFNEENATILEEALNSICFSKEDFISNDLAILVKENPCYRVGIILKNAKFDSSLYINDVCEITDAEIKKNKIGYSIFGEQFDYENDTSRNIQIDFEIIEFEVKQYKAKLNLFNNANAWECLSNYALSIRDRFEIPYLNPNEKEKEIYPLARSIAYLIDSEDVEECNLDEFRKHLPSDKKLDKLFSTFAKRKNNRSLFLYLSKKKFESAWRNILELFDNSQKTYDSTDDLPFSDGTKNLHKSIDKLMLKNGYLGSYPSYKKIVKINGIHNVSNFKNTYTIALETANIIINCEDCSYNEGGEISFYTSIVLDKSDNNYDQYSCFFAKDGKGYFKADHLFYTIDENDNAITIEDTELFVQAICKNAEFKKLSKEEKRAIGGFVDFNTFLILLKLWIIIGIFFGILMTIGFMLVELIISLIFGEISSFPELFLHTPWWIIFLGSWLTFSGLMTIISVKAK